MVTKLTLSLDSKIIDDAKKYAKSKDQSLSRVVNELLARTIEEEKRNKINQIRKMAGAFELKNAEKSIDELRAGALKKKYDL